jgi:RNA polymerase sigma-70 factor (ECF subfamily)
LYTIANHVAANALRSRSRRPEVNISPRATESGSYGTLDKVAVAASGAMPTRQMDKAELRDVVREAMQGLSERQRMAVLLNKFEDMSYADIAAAMELTPQAVKSLLSRARVNLKELLEPYLDDGTRPQ